jgi:hypothetical protein
LREATPGGKVELGGLLELGEIAIEPRPFGEQFEDARLVEDVHLIFPNHVIDGRKPAAIADQHRGQTGQPVSHDAACQGMGMAKANPAR